MQIYLQKRGVLDMPTNKELFNTKMNALATSINTKAGSSGAKNLDQLKTAVDGISKLIPQTKTVNPSTSRQTVTPDEGYNGLTQVTVEAVTAAIDADIVAGNIKKDVNILGVVGTYEGGGAKPSYLLNDGDNVSDFYFNTDYDPDTFLASLTYDETDPDTQLDVCALGLGYFYAVDLTNDQYAIVWNDGTNIVPIYSTTAVPAFGVTTAGWQVATYTPDDGVDVSFDDIIEDFLDIMDEIVAQEEIAFGEQGIIPTGNQDIDTLNEYDVTSKATARISAAQRALIIPENIAEGVTILGVTGTHSGGGGSNPYLTFSSAAPFTLAINNNTKKWDGALYYSTDKTTWTEWDGTTTINSVNNKIYLRGANNTKMGATSSKYYFVINGQNVECDGNIETLLDYETVLSGYHPEMAQSAFQYLFKGCSALTKAPTLPALNLSSQCYYGMFSGCTNLTSAPDLPAKIIPQSAYNEMFKNCSALVDIPSLSHITTFSGVLCMNAMFSGCTSLQKLPIINVKTLTSDSLYALFASCSLIKISETQTGEYVNEYRIPATGTGTGEGTTAGVGSMFYGTGGTFTGTPTLNTTYYTSNTIVS